MSEIQPISPAFLSLLSGNANRKVIPFTREILLISISVAGTSHIPDIKELAPDIVPGVNLRMIRDTENKYDSMAIGIYFNDSRVGFVPMELNEIIARLMDAGKAFVCKVTSSEWKKNWFHIKADVYMIE